MIYFTSDLHLGHKNIIKYTDRPFSNVETMNKILIDNYNDVVKQDDTVYILGDLTYRAKKTETYNLIKKLNGRKILIRGNHDIKYDESLFEKISDFEVIQYNRKKFCLMHDPMVSWPGSNHGSIQLHGHVHSTMHDNIININNKVYRYDVGVDANNYYPVSIDDVLSIFDERKIDFKNVIRPAYPLDAAETVREYYGRKK